jgi:hypothetical protein
MILLDTNVVIAFFNGKVEHFDLKEGQRPAQKISSQGLHRTGGISEETRRIGFLK